MEPTANSPRADQQQNQLVPHHASSRHPRFSGTILHTNNVYAHLKSINITKINYQDIFKSVDEEVRIDIRRESENAAASYHHHQYYLTHEAWAKHINQLKQSKLDNSSSIMGETALALCGQALGAVVANALSANNNNNNNNSSSSSSWALCFVEFAVVLGLSFTIAGISLHRKQRRSSLSSVLLTKIGAAATASATIISLALQLPPPMAWTFGLSAFFIVAVAVALT